MGFDMVLSGEGGWEGRCFCKRTVGYARARARRCAGVRSR